MAAWRRRTLEEFPELRDVIADGREIFSVYALWFELLPLARQAHRDRDEDLLRRIYAFAEWCYDRGTELAAPFSSLFTSTC